DTIAIITNMDQPLGYEIGNSNEVMEAIKVLRGEGSLDETEIALAIAANMCLLGGAFSDIDEAYKELKLLIESGKAIEKLKELIRIQGGDPRVVDDNSLFPQAKNTYDIRAERDGYIYSIDAESIGIGAMLLGAGRKTKEESIDPAAGIRLVKKIGD